MVNQLMRGGVMMFLPSFERRRAAMSGSRPAVGGDSEALRHLLCRKRVPFERGDVVDVLALPRPLLRRLGLGVRLGDVQSGGAHRELVLVRTTGAETVETNESVRNSPGSRARGATGAGS